ncbi:hypothetical protein DFH11DRAFT_1761471 [Phellopilus nigrolimitatus]|nr:hypothetical protein DFH11DRAFT_1761471 [Phellopilus nigrolimitatus]
MMDNLSFAAASDAARHANASRTEDPSVPEDAARAAAQDAARVASAAEPGPAPLDTPAVDLTHLSRTDARVIASEEHKALGYRPPPGSLAAHAQAAAAREAVEAEGGTARTGVLKEAARVDAARIAVLRGDPVGAAPTVDLDGVSKESAARLQSEEHKRLGHRPPPGSLAAQAQSAADRNATGNRINGGPGGVDISQVTQDDASRLMSEEQRRVGHRPPHDSLAAQAQIAVNSRSD